jgi:TetR/AcrR family tetracycline transcriptional repressor
MDPHAATGGGSGSGSGSKLDRGVVVRAALRSIDERGAESLTMRGLGLTLGVEAMSLYRYVSGREDLLEAVVTHLLSGISERLDDQLTNTWQGYLQSLAHEVRKIAVDHPQAFPLVATRHPAAPWLRPPLRSLELVEDFVSMLSRHGLSDDQVAAAYRSFSSFLLGQLLLEAAVRGAATGPVEEPLDEGDADVPNRDGQVDLTDSPTTARLRPLLSEDHSDEEFEIGLETLLNRMELALSQ